MKNSLSLNNGHTHFIKDLLLAHISHSGTLQFSVEDYPDYPADLLAPAENNSSTAQILIPDSSFLEQCLEKTVPDLELIQLIHPYCMSLNPSHHPVASWHFNASLIKPG